MHPARFTLRRGAIPLLVVAALLILVIAVFVGTQLIQQRQKTVSQAAEAVPTIKIVPSKIQVAQIGKEFIFNIFIDTAGKSIVGADVDLTFDPAAIMVFEEGIETGDLFPQYIGGFEGGKMVNTTSGRTRISISGLADPDDPNPPAFVGDAGLFATVRARLNYSTTIDVVFTPGATDDSNLTEAGTGNDILAQVKSSVLTGPPVSGPVDPTLAVRNYYFDVSDVFLSSRYYFGSPSGAVQMRILPRDEDFDNVDIWISGWVKSLVWNRPYTIWLCSSVGECRTSDELSFTTDSNGDATFLDRYVSYDQRVNPIAYVGIYEDESVPLPSFCKKSQMLTKPCMKISLSFDDIVQPDLTRVGYTLRRGATSPEIMTIPVTAPDTAETVFVWLADRNGNPVPRYEDVTLTWESSNSDILSIEPFEYCGAMNGPGGQELILAQPCPKVAGRPTGLAPGEAAVTVTASQRSTRKTIDSTEFGFIVTPAPTPEPTPTPSPTPTPVVGDYNNDRVVNALDFSVMVSNWGRVPEREDVDLNDDARVNTVDYGILLQNYQRE